MNKKEARDILFTLVYEYEFNTHKTAAEIYDSAIEERGFENFRYIKKGISDIVSKRAFISDIIEKFSDGWKVSRIAPVTRAILFVAVYDIVCKNTAAAIAINEAVELAKKYAEDSAPSFINGILNSVAENAESLKNEEETLAENADSAAADTNDEA